MRIFAVDPGPEQSGWCWYEDGKVLEAGCDGNLVLRFRLGSTLRMRDELRIAIEMIQSYGQVVGASTFQTCVEIGRFLQIAGEDRATLIPRPTVKNVLCGTSRAKDKDVWQAIKDRFGGESAVGTKKAPGPLYGVKSHARMALAVALAYEQMEKEAKT